MGEDPENRKKEVSKGRVIKQAVPVDNWHLLPPGKSGIQCRTGASGLPHLRCEGSAGQTVSGKEMQGVK